MARITGKEGSVSFLGSTVNITKWSLEIACDIIDITSSSSINNAKEYISNGRNVWSGTFESIAEIGSTGISPSTFFAVTINLTTAADHLWSGNAYIRRKNTSVDVSGTEPVKIQYEFQGTGLLSVYAEDVGGFEMVVT